MEVGAASTQVRKQKATFEWPSTGEECLTVEVTLSQEVVFGISQVHIAVD
jgi:hypothetical protein